MSAIVITGIQASGSLHLGNYLGAIRPMLEWQSRSATIFFFVADLHALTTVRDPAVLRRSVLEVVRLYLAAGLDPQKVTIFVQSAVPAHSEAAWLLQCVAPMGELRRMTQFKQKQGTAYEGSVKVGLYTYPVLQAADVLLYQADFVPVGEDQLQHLELMRTLANKFHHWYGEGIFKIPKSLVHPQAARVMSLDNPRQKMSKSGDPSGCLYLLDSPDKVARKIKKAVTDMEGTVRYDVANKPGISNLLMIHHLLSGVSMDDLERLYADKGYGVFKGELVEVVCGALEPIRESYADLIEGDDVVRYLQRGSAKAREVAGQTLHRMQRSMGIESFGSVLHEGD
ncbi:tryptophan--tRNA ligase [Pasteuria penetrans]|uniref:tryptophan--tRNA ligase n=1 Tax=Pasteuria penetrans TaxID=86005 RepID=UPI000FBD0A41|nr:tryptophan--tRNA ligase [Pasteuria penetrans]